jgi:hypothetical protein
MQQKVITLEGGTLKVMGTNESVFQIQASQPMQQTPEFLRALSRIAAIGFDMPLEVALRDLSQVNFSGGQLGMKGYERTCRVRQDWHKSQCWNRITFWWLSVERQRQQFGYPDAFKTPFPDDFGTFELHAREWLLRDRQGEAAADLLEFAIGVGSPQRACAQRSIDYKDVLAQRESAWKDNEAAGLPNVLPSTTRDVLKPGPCAPRPPRARRSRATVTQDTTRHEQETIPRQVRAPPDGDGVCPGDYSVKGGVATIPVVGILTKYPMPEAWMDEWCGTVPALGVLAALDKAMADWTVKSVVFLIDSPGGMVAGTSELADAIAAYGKSQPGQAHLRRRLRPRRVRRLLHRQPVPFRHVQPDGRGRAASASTASSLTTASSTRRWASPSRWFRRGA